MNEDSNLSIIINFKSIFFLGAIFAILFSAIKYSSFARYFLLGNNIISIIDSRGIVVVRKCCRQRMKLQVPSILSFFPSQRETTGAVDASVKSQKKYPPLVSQRGVPEGPPREGRKWNLTLRRKASKRGGETRMCDWRTTLSRNEIFHATRHSEAR